MDGDVKRDVDGARAQAVVAQVLALRHREFLAFLSRRLGDRAAAEEVLQTAVVRALERAGGLRDEERATAWLYRLLRNALVDHLRRQSAGVPSEADVDLAAPDVELESKVCACVAGLVDTLKPEYAEALRAVDLEDASVGDFAASRGLTPNNAHVRLHRARAALARRVVEMCGTCCEHGCVDCECPNAPRKPRAPGAAPGGAPRPS